MLKPVSADAIGVRAHHWNFGDKPAVEAITRDDVTSIITYIRELQRANGINGWPKRKLK